jgi:hypothetical protein
MDKNDNEIEIFFKNLDNSTYKIKLSPKIKLAKLKQKLIDSKLTKSENIKYDNLDPGNDSVEEDYIFEIIFNDNCINDDDKTLEEYSIVSGSILLEADFSRKEAAQTRVNTKGNIIIDPISDANNDPSLTLEIKMFHKSCSSVSVNEWNSNNIGGFIVLNEYFSENPYIKIKPGYVYVQKITQEFLQQQEEGQIHGNLVYDFFKKRINELDGILIEGFGRKRNQPWSFNSITLNSKRNTIYQDDGKTMSGNLSSKLEKALDMWEKKERIGQNIPLSEISTD